MVSTAVKSTLQIFMSIAKKYIKIGQSYGMPFESHNGFGQGDSYSLMVALALVSIQFDYIQDNYSEIKLGSCVDDRNIRGNPDMIIPALQDMAIFDSMTGNFNNPEKVAITAATLKIRTTLAPM